MPKTENISNISMINEPTLKREGKIYISVSINTLRFLLDQMSQNILKILKALIALAAVEKLKSV